jgi:hypothetical protein
MAGITIRVYDKNLNFMGEMDDSISTIWKDTYNDKAAVGDVKILANVTDINKKLLAKGNILVKRGPKPDFQDENGKWYRAAQIRYRHVETTYYGEEQIEAQAMGLKAWFSRRVIVNKIEANTTDLEIINQIFDENIGEGADEERQMPIVKLFQPVYKSETVEYSNEDYSDVETEIEARCVNSGLGYDILVEERSKLFGFWLYQGDDRSSGNTSGYSAVVISRDYDTAYTLETTETDESYRNTLYTTGADDDNGNTPLVVVGGGSGIDRSESYYNGSGISRTYTDAKGNEKKFTEAQYLNILNTAAQSELADLSEKTELVSELSEAGVAKYMTNFWLGDIISCVDTNWNVREDARVAAVEYTIQNGVTELEITFGDTIAIKI